MAGNQGQGAALAGRGNGFLLVAGGHAALVGLNPDLQKMGFLALGMVELTVFNAGAGTHALHVPWRNAFDVTHAVLVGQIARQHIADDFHVLVAMGAKTSTRGNAVFVDDAQIAPAHVGMVVVASKRKTVK